jgi:hypothetical protein
MLLTGRVSRNTSQFGSKSARLVAEIISLAATLVELSAILGIPFSKLPCVRDTILNNLMPASFERGPECRHPR